MAVTYYLVYIGGIKKDSSTTANISITGLSANTAYSFYVKAKDAAGNISASSSTLNITTSKNTDTQAPTAPSKPVSSNITGNSFTLSWSASTDNVGVVSYELYLGSDLIGTATGTTYTYSSAVPSTTYLVTIKAKDAAGNLSSACAIQVLSLIHI